jgi:hypothetical protein
VTSLCAGADRNTRNRYDNGTCFSSPSGSRSQDIRQWIVDVTWLAKRKNVAIVVHGVSLSLRGSGKLHTRLDRPPISLRHHPFSRIAHGRNRGTTCFLGVWAPPPKAHCSALGPGGAFFVERRPIFVLHFACKLLRSQCDELRCFGCFVLKMLISKG